MSDAILPQDGFDVVPVSLLPLNIRSKADYQHIYRAVFMAARCGSPVRIPLKDLPSPIIQKKCHVAARRAHVKILTQKADGYVWVQVVGRVARNGME